MTVKITNTLKLLPIVLIVPILLIGLLIVYDYVSVISGFHEWQDAYDVRHYKLATDLTLQSAVEGRLRSHGINKRITWSASCYGPSAIITSCTNSGDYPWRSCLGFEFYHGEKVVSANQLASEIVPELEHGSFHHGIALDNAKLDNLK